jgi:hypothetical protein
MVPVELKSGSTIYYWTWKGTYYRYHKSIKEALEGLEESQDLFNVALNAVDYKVVKARLTRNGRVDTVDVLKRFSLYEAYKIIGKV